MMKAVTTVVLFLFLVNGARAQGELELSDFFDNEPKPPTKAPEKPKDDETKKPASGGELDLSEFFNNEPKPPTKAPQKPKDEKPKKPAGDGDMLDLADALLPDNEDKKPVPPKSGGGLSDADLINALDDYKPDGGKSGGRSGGDRTQDRSGGGTNEKPQEAGSGQIAGIVSAIAVAVVGAASSYFAYQKKKLCFKMQGGSDPERGKGQHDVHSDPQVFSNLIKTS